MDKRIGVIGVIIENKQSVEEVNKILHQYENLFVGRMGVPYKEKEIAVITLIADGTVNDINAVTGSLGRIAGVSAKSILTKNKNIK